MAPRVAAISVKTVFCFFHSVKLPGAGVFLGKLEKLASSQTITTRSGSWYGKARNSSACTVEKMAVFAPMPSARASTAIAPNAGDCRSTRSPYRASANRFWITVRIPPYRRKVTGAAASIQKIGAVEGVALLGDEAGIADDAAQFLFAGAMMGARGGDHIFFDHDAAYVVAAEAQPKLAGL